MTTGFNWRTTLSNFASISGVLAGFCVTFIALILGGQLRDFEICTSGVTSTQMTVLLFGVSSGLFICAMEFFLHAKEFDVFSVPKPYLKLLREGCEEEKRDWAEFEDEQTKYCRKNERIGRHFYNIAIFLMFIGLFFAIAPYNIIIALIAGGLGMILELWQILGK